MKICPFEVSPFCWIHRCKVKSDTWMRLQRANKSCHRKCKLAFNQIRLRRPKWMSKNISDNCVLPWKYDILVITPPLAARLYIANGSSSLPQRRGKSSFRRWFPSFTEKDHTYKLATILIYSPFTPTSFTPPPRPTHLNSLLSILSLPSLSFS